MIDDDIMEKGYFWRSYCDSEEDPLSRNNATAGEGVSCGVICCLMQFQRKGSVSVSIGKKKWGTDDMALAARRK